MNTNSSFTPDELLLGRPLRLPIVILYGQCQPSTFTAIDDFKIQLSKMFVIIRNNINAKQKIVKFYYDRKRITEGDLTFRNTVLAF